MRGETARGSAFVVREDGLVFTNAHVIDGTNYCTGKSERPRSEEEAAREMGRAKEEGLRRGGKKDTFCLFVAQSFTKVFRAKLVSMDEARDIAALCLTETIRPHPSLGIAKTGSFTEGTEVLTIGSPLGNTNMLQCSVYPV
jgi:S1-C subfamily serine protease